MSDRPNDEMRAMRPADVDLRNVSSCTSHPGNRPVVSRLPRSFGGPVLNAAPALLIIAFAAAILVHYDVPLESVLLTTIYYLLTACVPGTLLWRMLPYRGAKWAGEDLIIGTTTGIAVQTILAFAFSALGHPRWAIIWIIAVVTVALLRPDRRTIWLRKAPPLPHAFSFAMVGIVGCVLWSALRVFRAWPIATVPGSNNAYYWVRYYVDMPFQQGLTWALGRGFPTSYPFLSSSDISYQIGVMEHWADLIRWTSVDSTLVVARLGYPVLIVLSVLMVAVLAYRIVESHYVLVFAPTVAFFAVPPLFFNSTPQVFVPFTRVTLASPTQIFCEPLFMLLLLLIWCSMTPRVKVRGGVAAGISFWSTLAIVAICSGIAKGTPLPLALCGGGLALVSALVGVRSGIDQIRRILLPLVVVTCAWLVAFLGIMGAGLQGSTVSPHGALTTYGSQLLSVISHGPIATHSMTMILVALLLTLLASVVLSVPTLVSVTLTRFRQPFVWWMIGVGIGGISAFVLVSQPGGSQFYFLNTCWRVMGVCATIGMRDLWLVVRRRLPARLTASLVKWTISFMGLGFLTTCLLPIVGPSAPAPEQILSVRRLLLCTVAPWFDLIIGSVLVGLVALLAYRVSTRRFLSDPQHVRRQLTGLLFVVSIAATVVQGAALGTGFRSAFVYPDSGGIMIASSLAIPTDGAQATLWIRENTDPNSIIATNAHCLVNEPCNDGRHFWMSAMAERQFFIEGWWYANPSKKSPGSTFNSPTYWDPDALARNDDAFRFADPTDMAWLRTEGVSYMLVDRTVFPESDELRDAATCVFDSENFAVYRLSNT